MTAQVEKRDPSGRKWMGWDWGCAGHSARRPMSLWGTCSGQGVGNHLLGGGGDFGRT